MFSSRATSTRRVADWTWHKLRRAWSSWADEQTCGRLAATATLERFGMEVNAGIDAGWLTDAEERAT